MGRAMRIWCVMLLHMLIAGPGAAPAEGRDLHVFAAASLMDALQEVAKAHEKAGEGKVFFNFGGSSILARQIEAGAPADIFFSADEKKMEQLEQKGLVVEESKANILSNTLVIVGRADARIDLKGPEDLAGLKRIALGETTTVPAGIYAREYLESVGVWEKVKAKVIPTENVRAALAAVKAGNVDAAIVYRTDAKMSRKARVLLEIPAEKGPKIVYPAAVLKESGSRKEAEAFMRFLSSEGAKEIFRKHGFLILEKNG